MSVDGPSSNTRRTAAVLSACALGFAALVGAEGWVLHPSPDPIGKITACAGVTEGLQADRTYTDAECQVMTSQAFVKIGLAIAPCIKAPVSELTRSALNRFAYNVGPAAFCSSTLARKLNAGDLAGACAQLSKWIYAGGKVLPGLVTRRAAERATCEAGLPPPAASRMGP